MSVSEIPRITPLVTLKSLSLSQKLPKLGLTFALSSPMILAVRMNREEVWPWR
jgi:hypothetical protein